MKRSTKKLKDETVIYIPTRGRIEQQLTIQRIPDAAKGKIFLVAPRKEAKKLERNWEVPVIAQPDEVQTISQKRAWIIEQCRSERMFMLDDDLRFCLRRSFESPSILTVTPDDEEANRQWNNLELALEHYAHAGLAARMGAQEKKHTWHFCTRMMYVLGYQTRIIQECDLGRINTREDMDYTLQLFAKGYRNVVNYRLVVDQTFDKPGGMRGERTIEKSNKDAYRLKKLHPGVDIKIEEKAYTHSVPRKEVRIDWKKAYNKDKSSETEYDKTVRLLKKWNNYDNRTRRAVLDHE